MRTALYPGSFNPWHPGHADVLRQACAIFDIVLVCQMQHENKAKPILLTKEFIGMPGLSFDVVHHGGLMKNAVKEFHCDAVIRGFRPGYNVEEEAKYVYWNRALGLDVPFFHILTAQRLSHISSTDIRALGAHWDEIKSLYE